MKNKENSESTNNRYASSYNKEDESTPPETTAVDTDVNKPVSTNTYNMDGFVYPYVKQRFPSASLRHRSISLLNRPGINAGGGGYSPYCKPCCCSCHTPKEPKSCSVGSSNSSLLLKPNHEDYFLDFFQADYKSYLSLDRFVPKCASYFRTSRMPEDHVSCCGPITGGKQQAEHKNDEKQPKSIEYSRVRSKSEGSIADQIMEKNNALVHDSIPRKSTTRPTKISSKLQLKKSESFRAIRVSSSKPCSPAPPEYQYIPRSTPKYVLCGFCNRVYSHRSMEIHSRQCKKRFVPRSKKATVKKLSKKIESPSMIKLCEATRRKRSKSEGENDMNVLQSRLLQLGKQAEKALKRSLSKKILAPNILPSLNNEDNSSNNDISKGITYVTDNSINNENINSMDIRPLKETLKRERRKSQPDSVLSSSRPLRPIKPRALSAAVTKNVDLSISEHLIPHPPPKYRKCNHCGKNYETKLKSQHMNKCSMLKILRRKKSREEKAEKENITVAAPIVTAVGASSNTSTEDPPVENGSCPPPLLHPPEFQKCKRCGAMYGSQSLAIHEKQCTGPK